MNKNEIAQQINCVDNITRTLTLDNKDYFKIGDIYTSNKAESWSGSNCTESFHSELDNEYEYVLKCKSVSCHKVDYENKEECKILDCEGCENEGEVLVPANTKMKIVSISTYDDYNEMGYYEIQLILC